MNSLVACGVERRRVAEGTGGRRRVAAREVRAIALCHCDTDVQRDQCVLEAVVDQA